MELLAAPQPQCHQRSPSQSPKLWVCVTLSLRSPQLGGPVRTPSQRQAGKHFATEQPRRSPTKIPVPIAAAEAAAAVESAVGAASAAESAVGAAEPAAAAAGSR